MDFGFHFRDHVLSHTVYKPGGVTETSHRCLSSYHDLQVSRLCYIIVACPLTTTSRVFQLHRLEPHICCCAGHSGLELTAINNPDNFVVFRTPSTSLDVVLMLVVIALQSSIEQCPSRANWITRRCASCQGENFRPPHCQPSHHWISPTSQSSSSSHLLYLPFNTLRSPLACHNRPARHSPWQTSPLPHLFKLTRLWRPTGFNGTLP
jgi:hypothetical protein